MSDRLRERAETLAAAHLRTLRACSYAELSERLAEVGESHVALPLPDAPDGSEGPEVVLETGYHWDDTEAPGGNLRVIVSVWVPGRVPSSLVDLDFIIAPDGRFVGE